MSEILDTSSNLATVERAIKLVEQLRSEGLPAANAIQPLSSFTSSQREYLQKRLRHVADQHVEAVVSVQATEVRSNDVSFSGNGRRISITWHAQLTLHEGPHHCAHIAGSSANGA